MGRYLVRDLVLVTIASVVWLLNAESAPRDGLAGDFLGTLAGLFVGGSIIYLHEWGHYLAAATARARLVPRTPWLTAFTFDFDPRNPRGKFYLMTLGGWLFTALGAWLVHRLAPGPDLASRLARGLTLVYCAMAIVTEVPTLVRAVVRHRLPGAAKS